MGRQVCNTRVALHVHVYFERRRNGIKEAGYKVFRTLSFYDIRYVLCDHNMISKDRLIMMKFF